MNMEKFTTRLQQALADAQSIAVGRDHNYLQPEHLLTAMLEQEGSNLTGLLRRVGCD